MSKTEDVETVVLDWLTAGPLTIDDIADRFRGALPGEELTWLGIAMRRLERAGQVRYPSCTDGHNHDDPCTVELTR